jgi:hypothetical protein
MSQIALVTDQHDDDIGICVVSEFLKPSRYVVVGLVFADVVDEQCANSTSVVCGCDGSIALLTCCVPDLRLDGLAVD